MIAMLSDQDTACHEAALCAEHDTPANRAALAAAAQNAVPDSWTDVSGNDYIVCTICGYNEHQMDTPDPNAELRRTGRGRMIDGEIKED